MAEVELRFLSKMIILHSEKKIDLLNGFSFRLLSYLGTLFRKNEHTLSYRRRGACIPVKYTDDTLIRT